MISISWLGTSQPYSVLLELRGDIRNHFSHIETLSSAIVTFNNIDISNSHKSYLLERKLFWALE